MAFTALVFTAAGLSIVAALHDDASVLLHLQKHEQAKGLEPAERHVQALNNFKDIEYSGNFTLGNQILRGILDTGSFELIVVSTQCKSRECEKNPKVYNGSKSENYKDHTWKKVFTFGSGDVSAKLATDTMKLGTATSTQSFWEVTDSHLTILEDASFEMIVGLGNPREPVLESSQFVTDDVKYLGECSNSTDGCPAWLQNQYKEDQHFVNVLEDHSPMIRNLGIQVYSLCFKAEPGAPGYITWNDYDPTKQDTLFSKVRISGKLEWSANMTDLVLRGGENRLHESLGCTGESRCAALFDSGTSLLMAPSAHVEALEALLKEVSCSNITRMPSITFRLDEAEIILAPEMYIGKMTGRMPRGLWKIFPHWAHLRSDIQASSRATEGDASEEGGARAPECGILIGAADSESEFGVPLWVLGMPFFRHYYTSFMFGDPESTEYMTCHVAPADPKCQHPSEADYVSFAERPREARTLDASRLRVPKRLLEPRSRARFLRARLQGEPVRPVL